MSLRITLPRPRFHRWLSLLILIGLAWLVVAAVRMPPPEDSGSLLERFAERQLFLRDGIQTAPPQWRWLGGYLSIDDLDRELADAYRTTAARAALDPELQLQFAIMLLATGRTDAGLGALGPLESTGYARMGDVLKDAALAPAGKGEMPEIPPAVEEAVFRSDSWWGRQAATLLGLEAPRDSGKGPEAFRRAVIANATYYGLLALSIGVVVIATIMGNRLRNLPAQTVAGVSDPGSGLSEPGYNEAHDPAVAVAGVSDPGSGPSPKYAGYMGSWGVLSIFHGSLRVVALVVVLGAAGYALLGAIGRAESAVGYVVVESVARLGPVALLLWWYFPNAAVFVKSAGLGLRALRSRRIWLFAAAGMLLVSGSDMFCNWLARATHSLAPGDYLDPNLITGSGSLLLAELWVAGIVAPLSEEIFLRGFVYPALRRRIGVWPAIALSSIAFALLHYYSWPGMLSVFLSGAVFAWIYQKSGSLWPPVLVHALGNLLATAHVWWFFGLDM